MAKNGKQGDGHRNGHVTNRSQFKNLYEKRDANTDRIMEVNINCGKFKGVRKEK